VKQDNSLSHRPSTFSIGVSWPLSGYQTPTLFTALTEAAEGSPRVRALARLSCPVSDYVCSVRILAALLVSGRASLWSGLLDPSFMDGALRVRTTH
jgi:hypothetical protein